jgi:hypothetical protein
MPGVDSGRAEGFAHRGRWHPLRRACTAAVVAADSPVPVESLRRQRRPHAARLAGWLRRYRLHRLVAAHHRRPRHPAEYGAACARDDRRGRAVSSWLGAGRPRRCCLGTAGPRRGPARGGMGSESGLAPREGRASDERARQAAGAVAPPRSARRRQRGRRSRRRRVRPRTRRGSARARPRADGRAERTPPSTAIRRRGRLRHEDVSTHRALSARPGGPSSAGLRRGRRRQGPGGRRRSGEGCPEISGTSRATAGARGARDRAASARPAR